MENSRTCEVSNANVHRAPYIKHLRSKKHLDNGKQNQLIVSEWVFKDEQAPRKKMKKFITLKH